MKILAFDTETTGLDANQHDIINLACLMIIDGEVVSERSIEMAPTRPQNIDDQALEIHGISRETLLSYRPAQAAHEDLVSWLGFYIDKFNPGDKAYPLAYNGHFDMDFLSAHFRAVGDNYLGSWIYMSRLLDPLALCRIFDYVGRIHLSSYKLEAVARHFEIPLTAHNALSDTRAAWEIFKRLTAMMMYGTVSSRPPGGAHD